MDELARSGGYRRRDFVRGAAGGVLGATALVGLGWAEAAMGAVVPIASLTASQRETYEALLRAGLLYERSVVDADRIEEATAWFADWFSAQEDDVRQGVTAGLTALDTEAGGHFSALSQQRAHDLIWGLATARSAAERSFERTPPAPVLGDPEPPTKETMHAFLRGQWEAHRAERSKYMSSSRSAFEPLIDRLPLAPPRNANFRPPLPDPVGTDAQRQRVIGFQALALIALPWRVLGGSDEPVPAPEGTAAIPKLEDFLRERPPTPPETVPPTF